MVWVPEKFRLQFRYVIKFTGDEIFAASTKEYWTKSCKHVQNTEARYTINEGVLNEGFEIVMHIRNDNNVSNGYESSTTSGERADSGQTSGLPLTPSIAPLSMDRDEDMWLTQKVHFCIFTVEFS